MGFLVKDNSGRLLDARIEVEGGNLVLHSRSGRSRTSPGRNTEYVPAFDAIFARINVPTNVVERVLLDSIPAQAVPEPQRLLASREDFAGKVLKEVMNQVRRKMRMFGRLPGMPLNEGNQNKKIRIETSLSQQELVRRLRLVPRPGAATTTSGGGDVAAATSGVERLPASELRKVLPSHIYAALERLENAETASDFHASRDYDALLPNGARFAPKAVFGLALEDALGIKAQPGHFEAGWGKPCFDILEEAGLWLVPKHENAARPRPDRAVLERAVNELSPTDEERTWIEGNPRIVTHLKKEREPGLARKKRKAFLETHGKLYCERCKMDPVATYGEDAGQACIEVHHDRVQVSEMLPGHETKLEDLACLCSNCHRVLHRALTLGVDFEFKLTG